MTAFEDYQLIYYANRGFTVGVMDDLKRDWYISDLGGAPALKILTIDDLELAWLKSKTSTTSNDVEDQWFTYLNPIYGPGKTVRDLRYELYKAG